MIMLCNHDLILLPSLYIFEYLNEAHKIVAWGRVGQCKWGRVGQFGAEWDMSHCAPLKCVETRFS